MTDYIPIDGRGANEYVRDMLIIERQWDRVMEASKNLLDTSNRADFKCRLLGLEAFLYPILKDNKEYINAREEIEINNDTDTNSEIRKCYDLIRIMRHAQDNSRYAMPESIDFED
jgi:hypothetical protein